MGCMGKLGLSILAASLATVGCGSAEPAAGTTKAEEETGAPGDDAADTGVEGEDSATVEDTAAALEYPAGPYGKAVGNVLPNLTWDGYRDGTGEWTKLSLLDYYDPDGTRGIRALKIGGAALW